MNGHGSDRAERLRSDVFWVETNSGYSQLHTIGPDDNDYVGCTDVEEATIGGKISDVWGWDRIPGRAGGRRC